MSKSTPMTRAAAARIQSTQAIKSGGQTPKGGFVARIQSAADKNAMKAPMKKRRGQEC